MPLAGTQGAAATAIVNQIEIDNPGVFPTPADKTKAISYWTTILGKLFPHLTTNVVVAVASVSGVTTGAGVSGPGSGTIT